MARLHWIWLLQPLSGNRQKQMLSDHQWIGLIVSEALYVCPYVSMHCLKQTGAKESRRERRGEFEPKQPPPQKKKKKKKMNSNN